MCILDGDERLTNLSALGVTLEEEQAMLNDPVAGTMGTIDQFDHELP